MTRRPYTPRPYGKLMTDHAIDVPRCALWADMGLGKTVCTYTALDAMFLATQVGGGHYKDMAIQPFEYIHKNGIGFAEGCAIKYLSRWKLKGGVEDLRKARHFIDLLIEAEVGS